MLIPRRLALACLLVSLSSAWAGDGPATTQDFFGEGSSSQTLALQEAIEMALKNNLDAKFERVGISVEEARRRSAAGVFDPVFAINTSHESVRRPENANDLRTSDALRQEEAIRSQQDFVDAVNLANGRPPISREQSTAGIDGVVFNQENDRSSSTLQGRTPLGTRYGFSLEANRLRNTFSGDTRQVLPEYFTSATVTVIQPLLKNFGPAANLAELRIARLNKKTQILTWKQRVATSVQAVMGTYYDMLYALRDIEVKQDAIAAGEKLLAQNRRRLELGFMSPIDVRQAEVAVSTDRESLVMSKGFLLERQFALKRLILDEFRTEDTRIFIPTTAPQLPVPKIDRPDFLRVAFGKRYDYQIARHEADVQDVRLRFARNQLWPQVDLVGTYGVNGLNNSFGSSAQDAISGHTPEWSAGLNFQVPLGNVQPRAQLNLVKGLKQQAVLRIKQTELNLGVDVDTVISRILTNQQRVDTARATRELNDEAVRIAYKRLEEGQISSFDIIETQRKLYEAKSRELAALAELNKSVTQLWLATGTILDRTGIYFDDEPASAPFVTRTVAPAMVKPPSTAPVGPPDSTSPPGTAPTPAPRRSSSPPAPRPGAAAVPAGPNSSARAIRRFPPTTSEPLAPVLTAPSRGTRPRPLSPEPPSRQAPARAR
jgi:outer membrane protein TolC